MRTQATAVEEHADKGIIHREVERDIVLEQIDIRRRRPEWSSSVIVFYGPVGIGKTTLLKETLRPAILEQYPALPISFINFDTDWVNDHYRGSLGQGQLILDIAKGLSRSFGPSRRRKAIRALLSSIKQAEKIWAAAADALKQDEGDKSRAHALYQATEVLVGLFNREFIPALLESDERRPALILMDTVEQLDRDFVGWIQETLQEPTTDTGQVLWVMTSRVYVDCQPFFLRGRYERYRLETFGPENVQKQLRGNRDLSLYITEVSHGLPEAAAYLSSTVAQKDPEDLQKNTTRKLAQMLSKSRYLGDIHPRDRACLEILSPLRLFKSSLVIDLLPEALQMYHDRYNKNVEPSAVNSLHVIDRLRATYHVSWSAARRGFVIEEPLRQIIADVLRQQKEPLYRFIHEKARSLFRDLAERLPENRLDYFIEILYHTAILELPPVSVGQKPDETDEVRVKAIETLGNMVSNFTIRYKQAEDRTSRETNDTIEQLRHQIDTDPDFEKLLTTTEKNLLLDRLKGVLDHQSMY